MASPRKPRRSGQDLMAISVAVNGRPARQRAYLEIIRQKARSWECNQQDRHYSRNRGRMSSARRRRCSSCLIVPSIRARYGASCIAPERPPRYDVCIFVLCMPTRNKITPTATKSFPWLWSDLVGSETFCDRSSRNNIAPVPQRRNVGRGCAGCPSSPRRPRYEPIGETRSEKGIRGARLVGNERASIIVPLTRVLFSTAGRQLQSRRRPRSSHRASRLAP